MQKITTCLAFADQAEQAAKLYTTVIPNSRIVETAYFGPGGPMPEGTVLSVVFELNGQEFLAINGGPHFKFTEAVSLSIACDTQEEIDELWAKLTAGGKPGPCGWLTDRFGVSWQVNPASLARMMASPDREKAGRAMQAMLQMSKLDIAALQRAYDGT